MSNLTDESAARLFSSDISGRTTYDGFSVLLNDNLQSHGVSRQSRDSSALYGTDGSEHEPGLLYERLHVGRMTGHSRPLIHAP